MKRVPVCIAAMLALLCGSLALAVNPDGDVNIDGGVDAVDVLWGYQTLMDRRTLSAEQQEHGDLAPLVAGVPAPDGAFDLGDVLVILRLALGELVLEYCGDGVLAVPGTV